MKVNLPVRAVLILLVAAVTLIAGCAEPAGSAGHYSTAVDSGNFSEVVLESDIPVLVDFWAEWCGPCRVLGPTVEEIAKEYEGRVKVCKLNVDDSQDLAARYQITGIPALLYFRNGEVVDRAVGVQSADEIRAALNKQL